MKAADTAGALAPFARRILTDEYVQRELRELIADVRRGSRRAKRVGPERAATDKRLRRNVVGATTAAAEIVKALNRPEPPKRHPLRTLAFVALGSGAGLLVYRRLMTTRSKSDSAGAQTD